MRLAALPKHWPNDKRLIDPKTKKIYYPQLEEVELKRNVEVPKKNKRGEEVLVSEVQKVLELRPVYVVDEIYGLNLLKTSPTAFLKLKEGKVEKKESPEYDEADYKNLPYRDLQAFYAEKTGKGPAGISKDELISALDEFFKKQQ